VQQFIDKLLEEWEESPPFFVTSAETKEGRELVLGFLEEMLRST
jgi:GTP-binding protein